VKLREVAFAAKERYHEALAYLQGPKLQGRKDVKGMVAEGQARLERARKFYRRKRGALEEAFPEDAWLHKQLPEIL